MGKFPKKLKLSKKEITEIVKADKQIHEYLASDRNDRTFTQIGYWLNKGYTKDLAIQKVTEYQNKTSLNAFIDRYGDNGIKHFNERIEKCRKTYYSKSDEERAIINKSRGRTNEQLIELYGKERALQILKAKLYDMEVQKQMQEITDLRRSQVGTGDRSERIRTYNFPQGRVTDHRIGFTLQKLDRIMRKEKYDA